METSEAVNHQPNKDQDYYVNGAKEMLAFLLRGSRIYGYRIVCDLDEDKKEAAAKQLITDFFDMKNININVEHDAINMAKIALNMRTISNTTKIL